MIKNTVSDFIDKTYSNTFENGDCNHFDIVGDKSIKKNSRNRRIATKWRVLFC